MTGTALASASCVTAFVLDAVDDFKDSVFQADRAINDGSAVADDARCLLAVACDALHDALANLDWASSSLVFRETSATSPRLEGP
jgi:hypothetical protein